MVGPLLLTMTARAAVPEGTALIASLAQPLPAKTAYFEQRESPLLAQPLQFSGVLERPVAGTLVKSVAQPYVERTVIADGRVSIERTGQPRRKFSLKRAPELVALTSSFEAILSGDASLLQQHYRIVIVGSAQAWTLNLTPREPRLAKRVLAIRLYGGLLGEQATLRCIDLDMAGAENSRMWIGDLAAVAMTTADATMRAALCTADAEAPQARKQSLHSNSRRTLATAGADTWAGSASSYTRQSKHERRWQIVRAHFATSAQPVFRSGAGNKRKLSSC